jgi:hypothetical protein
LIVLNVAATYVQQYFALDREPYPGYIQWKDPITNRFNYTVRGVEPHYPTAQAHIQGNSAAQLIITMAPVLSKLAQGGTLSTGDINKLAGILTGHVGGLSADALSKVLGKGIDLKSITKFASKLIPELSKGINGLMSGHLPNSVLDSGKVGAAMNDYTKNQALLAMKKKEMKKTVDAEPAEQQDAQIKAYNDAQAAAKGAGPGRGSIVEAPGARAAAATPIVEAGTATSSSTYV